jgi:tetratricopeptide (TPR) repeat protein
MDPNFGSAHLWLADVFEQKGEFELAISELRKGMAADRVSAFALAKLGHGLAKAGLRAEALSVRTRLIELSKEKYVSPFDIAMIHVGHQETDEAFSWLQKALEQRCLWLGYLNVQPQFDSLRQDYRFNELLGGVGLAQAG